MDGTRLEPKEIRLSSTARRIYRKIIRMLKSMKILINRYSSRKDNNNYRLATFPAWKPTMSTTVSIRGLRLWWLLRICLHDCVKSSGEICVSLELPYYDLADRSIYWLDRFTRMIPAGTGPKLYDVVQKYKTFL